MRCTPRSSSSAANAEIASRTLRAISSSRRGSTPISCCSSSSPSFARRSESRARTAAGCASTSFEAQNPGAFHDTNLRGRYLETTELAASYTHFLDALNGARRVDEIRIFRALEYDAKK